MFQNEFDLTETEKKVTEISLFISLVCGRYWNEAPTAPKAPLNYANLLKELEIYPNEKVATAGVKAFHRHLWYFLNT